MDKNPIDKDKIAENPHLLPYAHHVGSAIIRPIDKGKEKGLSMTAMYQQTESSLTQIKEQVETLIKQAQEIHDRIDLSEKIYESEVGFRPLIGQVYHLYKKKDGKSVISLISPVEWNEKCPYDFIASMRMLADHTWDILEKGTAYTERFKTDK